MSRSAWPLIYLRVVSVVWLVRLQVFPVQSEVKSLAQELVSCRTSSLMHLFVLFKETSMFCICMSFFWCFFNIALWCFELDCVENVFMVFFVHFLPDRCSKKGEACVIFPAFVWSFYKNPHKLPSLEMISVCCSLSVFRGLIWRTKVKYYHSDSNVCQKAAHRSFIGEIQCLYVKIKVSKQQSFTQCINIGLLLKYWIFKIVLLNTCHLHVQNLFVFISIFFSCENIFELK